MAAQLHQNFDYLLAQTSRISTEIAAVHATDVDRNARFPVESMDALRKAGVLSALVPHELGGAQCSMQQVSKLCSTLAQSCASSAMVLAMHYIQLACITRHGLGNDFFRGYLSDLVKHQYLLASVTSEVGTYGDTRSSVCAVQCEGEKFTLNKDATAGSYCMQADALLVTTRRDKDAAASDQVLVLVKKEDYTIELTGNWDTLGMRGTCSPPFKLTSRGVVNQIIPGSYSDSSSQTMVPYSHILWASLWWGIAADAVGKAANFVRVQARQKPGTMPPTAPRLAEVSMQLQVMKQNWQCAAQDFDNLGISESSQEQLSSMGWALRLNNLKIACSEATPQIVHKALQIIGIQGYKNDSPFSLGRQYRDALSGSLMVSNDRIFEKNASMLLVFKDAP